VKAKSSMVASTIPKCHIYHGKKDAYTGEGDLEKEGAKV
jgi:hypothetical protein